MLHAEDLSGLGEDGGAAVFHQQIHRPAQGGVGGQAGEAVAAAALQGQHQVLGGDGLPPAGVDHGQQLLHPADALLHGLGGAAHVLDHQLLEGLTLLKTGVLKHAVDVVALTAQGRHDGRAQIGVGGIAHDGAAEQIHEGTGHLHAAAQAGDEGHHSADVGVGGQTLRGEVVGDLPGHGGGAVAGHQNADVVAGGHPAVGADEALEGGPLLRRQELGGVIVPAEGVIQIHVLKDDVVAVHHGAGGGVLRCKADAGVVLENRLPLPDVPGRSLVARGHLGTGGKALALHLHAGGHVPAGHHHIVLLVQANKRRNLPFHTAYLFYNRMGLPRPRARQSMCSCGGGAQAAALAAAHSSSYSAWISASWLS